MTLRVALIAQFTVEHATGNDLKDTLESLGVDVWPLQEQDQVAWQALIDAIEVGEGPDAVIWNRTPTLAAAIRLETRYLMLDTAVRAGVPTIAFHLDRWWGLKREHEVFRDPYFRCQYVFTADGHDPGRWKAAEVNHFWSPPAIAARNCVKGTLVPHLAAEVVFIGTWWGYHREWGHREDLILWLQRYYGRAFLAIPTVRQAQIRGQAFTDQVASARVIVGDSCLVPDENGPWTNYCSDRVFEVPGRGGFLVHPYVRGICWPDAEDTLMVPGQHLACWNLGDFEAMRDVINHYLVQDHERRKVVDDGYNHVLAHHTYTHRIKAVFDTVGLDLT